MKREAICPECNNRSGDWIYKNTERRYSGDSYDFTVNVNLPYCEKCGSLVYDRDLEDKIREDVHAMIEEARKAKQMKEERNQINDSKRS